MKNLSLNKIFGAVVCSTLFLSCSVEDGEDGAIGPPGLQGEQGLQGPQGEQGPVGADGQDGTDGQDGNANVIYSDWIDADWNSINLPRLKEMNIPVPELDDIELRNKTVVQVYLGQSGTNGVYAMPGTGRWSNTWYSYSFGHGTVTLNGIAIVLESTNGVDLTEDQYLGSRGNEFRYVLIPESAQSGKLDYSNYEAVKSFYNLPD
ncbi:hypothetical protein GTQ34_09600 [Muricauda sp. JGD-17]|uniref:Collagen-like protein n=1 Tax=Flagellimonas ochracea TaxID=2696472 RepID=A0A964TDE3_9FLAO|nr:collagen-like protein [Allomuricauda ochracea]NAY92174.1 hypothetical protein [Allomuricauda ochracea]